MATSTTQNWSRHGTLAPLQYKIVPGQVNGNHYNAEVAPAWYFVTTTTQNGRCRGEWLPLQHRIVPAWYFVTTTTQNGRCRGDGYHYNTELVLALYIGTTTMQNGR